MKMNVKKWITSAIVLVMCSFVMRIDGGKIPSATLKTMEGKQINSSTFTNNGKPIVISFWATWCKPCKKELDAIHEVYSDWQKELGVKLIAISTDDSRNSNKVVTDVKTKGWEFEVYLDENGDFKRAMNVGPVPHTFVVDGNGDIVWSHNSYAEGDEDKLYEVLKKLASGQKIEEH